MQQVSQSASQLIYHDVMHPDRIEDDLWQGCFHDPVLIKSQSGLQCLIMQMPCTDYFSLSGC